MTTPLTPELIEDVIANLPPQGRVMLRLLLLQYLDLTKEDIDYIVHDRTDPRMLAGVQTKTPAISQETIKGIEDRVAHYRTFLRQKRGRVSLLIECLNKQIALTEALCTVSERLLRSRFGLTSDAIQELRRTARTAVPKPILRDLDCRWEQDDVTEEEYLNTRLTLEYQALLRWMDRQRKRLDTAKRELPTIVGLHLQDHEIAHIWGIPLGTLSGRKVKFLHQYLQGIQARLQRSETAASSATAPLDLWKETFTVLATKPIERMPSTYDNIDGPEQEFMERLRSFANGTMPEERETRFWLNLIQDTRPGAEHGSQPRNLFGLQRLLALLSEIDPSPEALEADLLARLAPRSKVAPEQEAPAPASEFQTTEIQEHILKSFRGD